MKNSIKTIRLHLVLFILALLFSGVTAFPLRAEIAFLVAHDDWFPSCVRPWLKHVSQALYATPDLVLYGTDWLAFAHIVIALFFIPVCQRPLQHKANIYIGMWACLLVFPLALIFGPLRGIPLFHRLIDCAFGLFGFLYLYYILKKINQLADPE